MLQSFEALAEILTMPIGPSGLWRANYEYCIPTQDGVAPRHTEFAVFDGHVPSFHTAVLAFVENGHGDPELELQNISYLGAPIALLGDGNRATVHQFSSPFVAKQIGEADYEDLPIWAAEELGPRLAKSDQLRLPFRARDLVLGETTESLRRTIYELIEEIERRLEVSTRQAFEMALTVIRLVALGSLDSLKQALGPLEDLAREYSGRVRLSNIPLESIGEIYESMATALDDGIAGVYYTPAWLARRAVSRLPARAFSVGRAADPACGSGTFLVAFLERWVDERAAKDAGPASTQDLGEAVAGMDVDSVAISSAHLTLDLFADRLDLSPPDWDLRIADSTSDHVDAAIAVGNLPFGYRSHGSSGDVGSVILANWVEKDASLQFISLILPQSFTYDTASDTTRALLRQSFRVDELVLLPEAAFDRSSVRTLILVASRAEPGSSVLVREIGHGQLPAYRVSGAGSNYTSLLPDVPTEPWVLSPFYAEFAAAENRCQGRLRDFVRIRVGMQPYGAARKLIVSAKDADGPAVLDNADKFLIGWTTSDPLPVFIGQASDLRRPGPTDAFETPKLVVRRVTNPRQRARLAARMDTEGTWFTDRFVGIWDKDLPDGMDLFALGAYLQTGLVEAWFGSQNPSRTLRTGTLLDIPVPEMPGQWWRRASELGRSRDVLVNARWHIAADQQESLFGVENEDEWAWLDAAVLSSFGLGEISDIEIWAYLSERREVGSLPG